MQRDLIEEPPHGDNHGSKASTTPDKGGRQIPLDVDTMLNADLIRSEGFGVVETSRGSGGTGSTYGAGDAGMTTHRGVLQGDEYIDVNLLRSTAEDALGFTYAEVTAAYKKGRPTDEQRQLREKIDSRLLALSRSGGNMTVAARVFGLPERTLDSALHRAKQREVEPIVKNPAVKTACISFISGEPGATPRRRRYSDSPEEWTGTVNLTDEEYANGFTRRPGNPAYWQFRLGTTPLRGGYVAPAKPKQTFPADWPTDEEYAEYARGA
jgi:hypothetical protein